MNLVQFALATARRLAVSPVALVRQSVEFLNRAEYVMVLNVEREQENGSVSTTIPFPAAVQVLTLLISARERLLEFSRRYPNIVVATTTPLPLHALIPQLANLVQRAAAEEEDEVDLSGGVYEQLRDGLANTRAFLNQLDFALSRRA
jgi:hypothetical protein